MNCLKYFSLLVFTFVFFLVAPASANAVNEWTSGPTMHSGHGNGQIVKLLDGRYMNISGPDTCCSHTTVTEILNETTNQWELSDNTNLARDQFTPVVLNDGRVLVAGGAGINTATDRAEIYDPQTDQWTEINPLNTARRIAVMVTLLDGRVLAISGGDGNLNPLHSTEIYDSATGTWTFTGDILQPICCGDQDVAVVLNDGRVLVNGTVTESSRKTQLYDPQTGTWSYAGDLNTERHYGSMVKLQDGRVLMVGGDVWGDYTASVELFDPTTNQWTEMQPLSHKRHPFNVLLLPNGKVFVAGGYLEGGTSSQDAEMYDPDNNTWTTLPGELQYGHGGGKLVQLANGDILMIGGWIDGSPSTLTEKYTLVPNESPEVDSITVTPNLLQFNTNISASAVFSDSDVSDTHTAIWDWGDGTTSNGTVNENNGVGTVNGTHSYTAAGVYTITLTVHDNLGEAGTQVYEYVSVYNPTNQSRFNGVRTFISPVGALSSNPTFSGPAQFGIRANYNGVSAAGDVHLHVRQANFDFESTSLNVLVITNNTAYIRGSGMLNGVPRYTYFVKGFDGVNDTVRFQIKNSNGLVIYDTQPGAADTTATTTAITGQIIIH